MPVITVENAADYARKATISRELNRQHAKGNYTATEPASRDPYVLKSLNRVRAQIELLHDKLDSVVSDPDASAGDLDRVAAAIERLRKVEQVLSNRPGPGNLKPSSPKQTRQPVSVDPVELPQSSTVPSVPPSQST